MHCQLSYEAEEAVKLFPVSVYYNEQHALDSPQPVVGGHFVISDFRKFICLALLSLLSRSWITL